MATRTYRELVEIYKNDPGSLTATEHTFVRRELNRHDKRKKDTDPYSAHKEQVAKRQRRIAQSGRDVSDYVHAPVNLERREKGWLSFRYFCEVYFPETFYLPWCADHEKVIGKIEAAAMDGGLFAFAMPRGSGKTELCKAACIWAMLTGHRDFVCLIAATEDHALKLLEGIKVELESNPLLEEDWSEVVGPIRALEGIANRCKGQLYKGERTQIVWTKKSIVLPTIPGSQASGAVVRVIGITGSLRGMSFKRPDRKVVRPSLVVIDDPQTDESARSASQNENRERVLQGAILGLAGPGKKIAGFMPTTVIQHGDMAMNVLDRQKHPAWQGETMKMVYSWPTEKTLWEQYADFRREALLSERKPVEANQLYADNREVMDAGSLLAWPARFLPDEVSALQHAQNLLQDRGESIFYAEYQNEPIRPDINADELTADQIMAKINNSPRGTVPHGVTTLTAFIDVQEKMLYWCVCGWTQGFSGHVIAYGTWPDQKREYFTLRDSRYTMKKATSAAGVEGAIHGGLSGLTSELLGREWKMADGTALRVSKCLIDAGYQTAAVDQFCRQSNFAAMVMPSHGVSVRAAHKPYSEYRQEPGERIGLSWRTPAPGKRKIKYALIDVNFWKTFTYSRLAVKPGDKGCLYLFGDRPEMHRLFADHLTAEYRVATQGRGRTVEEWSVRPDRPDNHWFDCLVGCAVAASMEGVVLPEVNVGANKKRKYTFRQAHDRAKARREGRPMPPDPPEAENVGQGGQDMQSPATKDGREPAVQNVSEQHHEKPRRLTNREKYEAVRQRRAEAERRQWRRRF